MEEDKKSVGHFISDLKKQLILNLDVINNKLDTYRTNINIVRYNLLNNDKIKDNQLPKFDFQKANEILNLFGNLLNGTIKNYNNILQEILNKNTTGNVNNTTTQKPEKKGYKKFGGIYPSEYANPNSKYYEGEKK